MKPRTIGLVVATLALLLPAVAAADKPQYRTVTLARLVKGPEVIVVARWARPPVQAAVVMVPLPGKGRRQVKRTQRFWRFHVLEVLRQRRGSPRVPRGSKAVIEVPFAIGTGPRLSCCRQTWRAGRSNHRSQADANRADPPAES